MEVVAEDVFESPENVTIGYPILTDKDFIAIVGRKQYSKNKCDKWFLSRRSDLFLGRDRASGLPIHVCSCGQELFNETL